MIEVPYPPPPAKVEVVPPPKGAREVWIDGQWDWDGRAWQWRGGAWVTPPAGAYFTPWTTERRDDGRLLFARAAWRGRDGRALEGPLSRATACSGTVAPPCDSTQRALPPSCSQR